jgi:hypothetical protein
MGESTLRRALCALLLAVLLAACGGGGGDDDESGGGEERDEPTTTTADDGAGTATTAAEGGADRSEDAQGYVDALATASETSGISRNPEENRCFAEAYVDTIGVDVLAEAVAVDDLAESQGITPDEIGVVMTPEQRDAFYTELGGCLDIKRFFVDAFTSGVPMTEADVACLSGALDDEALEIMVVAPFDGDTAPIENNQGFIDLIGRLTAACPAAMEAAGWT